MKTTYKLICYLVFAFAHLCDAQTNMDAASKRQAALSHGEKFKKMMQEFKGQGAAISLEDLSKAEGKLDTAFTGMEVLGFQLLLLESIMTRYDKSYDPKNPPRYVSRIPPPLGGTASPSEVEEYHKKVQENEAKAKRVLEQSKIRFMKSRILSYLGMSVKHHEQSQEAMEAKQKIIEFVAASSLDAETKSEIMQMVAPSSGIK